MKRPSRPTAARASTLDDYRAAKIVMDHFGEAAEHEALRHTHRLSDSKDYEGVARWMSVLAAIQELRLTTVGDEALH